MARRKKPRRSHPKGRVGRPRKVSPYRASWEPDFSLDPEVAKSIFGIVLIFLALFTLMATLGAAGPFGKIWYATLRTGFGWSAILLALIVGFLGVAIFQPEKYQVKASNLIGMLLIVTAFSGILHLVYGGDEALKAAQIGAGGGFLGYGITSLLKPLFSIGVIIILFLALLIIGVLLAFSIPLTQLTKREGVSKKITPPKIPLKPQINANQPPKKFHFPFLKEKATEKAKENLEEKASPLAEPEKVNLPPLDLLDDSPSYAQPGDIKKNMQIIQQTLAHFGIPVEMGEVNIGPTVTQYTLKPQEGIKLNKITALQNDLALALAAHPLRIEAPIPGKSYVGIEVPNKIRAVVHLREILSSEEFQNNKSKLAFSLGKDVAGAPIVANLDKMPHLLIAGATGTGKSICINSNIISLLYKNSPSSLKMILIDPKRVELPAYNDIPHLLTPVVTDHEKAISALKWTVMEMDRRYKIFEQNLKRDINSYNKTAKEKLPYIVTVIDELADLMMLAPKEVEASIVRLAQLARATGIHLVIATQRPSVDVITGLIKANITYRIAFATASQVDSRTILDMAGAEKLLGLGDMLYLSGDVAKPRRLQGSFVSEKEIKNVSDWWRNQGQPEYKEEVISLPIKSSTLFGEAPEDDLYQEAAEFVVTTGKASASLLQRRFRIGYARAARLLDLLEERGIVGQANGAKPRDVLVHSMEELSQLESLNEEYQEENPQ